MAALKGLVLAVDLAKRRRDAAVAALLQAQQTCQGARDQMGQLESYALETESHWALGARSRVSPEIVRHYDQFMDRLQQAVDLQQGVVGDHDQALASARDRVIEAEVRLAGLLRLLETRRAAQKRHEAGREQKHLDELAALQFRRLHANLEASGTS